MLEFIRRQSTSFMAWIILGAIALVFGLQFGLPSDSLTLGADSIAEVHGSEIRNEDYRFQHNLASRFRLVPKDAKMREMVGANEEIIDGIVERLLLAHEARRMGLASTKQQAETMVLDGHVLFLGHRMEFLGSDEKFNYETFTNNWLGPMRVAEPNYLDQQSDELLAQTLRDVVSASVLVPESELRREYEASANSMSLRYARYEFSAFADLVTPTPAQLDAYVAVHAEDLDKRYESQKTRFTELPRQARLALVQAPLTDDSRAALELDRTALADGVDGSKTFAEVARARSTHDTAARGGEYGWVDEQSETASDLPDAIRQAIPALAEGVVSELIEADGSLWLLEVTARREGDVPKEDALRELAEEGVRDELAKDLAQRAAEEDQNAVTAGNPIADVFSTPGALGETTLFGGTRIEDVAIEGEGEGEGEGDEESAPSDAIAGITRPKAEMRSTGPFGEGQRIPGLGLVPSLVDDATTQEVGDAELLPGLYEVPGAFVLAGLESKEEATDEGFAEIRDSLYARQRQLKGRRVLGAWSGRRCLEARARGDIKVSESTVKRLTTYDTSDPDEEGQEAAKVAPDKPDFSVCSRVGGGGGLLTARLR